MSLLIQPAYLWNHNLCTPGPDYSLTISPLPDHQPEPKLPELNFNNQFKTIRFLPGCTCGTCTSLDALFAECTHLKTIDMRGLDISSVTSMKHMFVDCISLTTVFLPKNPVHLQSTSYMFYNCYDLTTLDIESWVTPELYAMDSMFRSCTRLSSLDLSHLFPPSSNTRRLYTPSMFDNCSSLHELKLFQGTFSPFDLFTHSLDMTHMFNKCISLPVIDMSSITLLPDPDQVTVYINAPQIFKNCTQATRILLPTCSNAIITHAKGMFSQCKQLLHADLSSYKICSNNIEEMFIDCENLQSIHFASGNRFSNADSAFKNCQSLQTLNCSDWTMVPSKSYKFNTVKEMFFNCSSLKDFSCFSGTTDDLKCNKMFENCISLTHIDLSPIYFTSSANSKISCTQMFYNCASLVQCVLPQTTHTQLVRCAYMFEKCTQLPFIDLQSYQIFGGSISGMCCNCRSLQNIQFSSSNRIWNIWMKCFPTVQN